MLFLNYQSKKNEKLIFVFLHSPSGKRFDEYWRILRHGKLDTDRITALHRPGKYPIHSIFCRNSHKTGSEYKLYRQVMLGVGSNRSGRVS